MEVVKFQQAQLINSDLDMYYPNTDTPALCRTSSLVEELGQIEYVFSDKTGTLTRNEMEFRCCSTAGTAYAESVDAGGGGPDEEGKEGWRSFDDLRGILGRDDDASANPFLSSEDPHDSSRDAQVTKEFMRLLAVCHTVIPEVKDGGRLAYQASSPDEAALVAGAELLGYQFHVRVFSLGLVQKTETLLTLLKDSEAQVRVRKYSRQILRIRDSQCLGIQLDSKAHVDVSTHARGSNQIILQGCGHRHIGTAWAKPTLRRENSGTS
jgi:magnesium-transporting ATPase (P-type)